MEQFEQLLTCAICLDRYRNPKLLPCQHSFCMEPCMDGLVDYVRRQVKCPECRAEHRIPYQGVQAFPTNVTLQRFLELHIEITGELPDPTSGQIMERCSVCSEKSYCNLCAHCEKKCCPECKEEHIKILRKNIVSINSQVRRALHRLQEALSQVEKNTLALQTNSASVSEEVDEIYRRLNKALKDRTEFLRNEIDRYLNTELRGLIHLKENLEQEIANIQSNCDLADAHINENVPWDDNELLDTKELFLRTLEFIRNFEYEAGDYTRRMRFVMTHEPNQLVLHVAGYGELNIKPDTGNPLLGSSSSLAVPGGSPGLMRSKSDHRLASQYRQQDDDRTHGRNRYVPDYEYDTPEYEAPRSRSRYRSRFMRNRDGDDSDGDQRSTAAVRFNAPQEPSALRERERVLDTEDASRGPLSGIFRLTDSPRVMKKLNECERAGKRKKDEPSAQTQQTQQPKTQVQQAVQRKVAPPPTVGRQVSEDDEISRIKKQNKNATTQQQTQAAALPPDTLEERQPTPLVQHSITREEQEETARKTPISSRRTSTDVHAPSGGRSASSESSTSSESSGGSGIRSTGAPFTTEEMKQKYLSRAPQSNSSNNNNSNTPTNNTNVSSNRDSPVTTAATPRPFQSRFLGAGNRAAPPPPQTTTTTTPTPTTTHRVEEVAKITKKDEEDEEDETSSSSEETESETEEESETDTRNHQASNSSQSTVPMSSQDQHRQQRSESAMARTDIGPLLARSAEARRGSKEESPSTRYGTPRSSPAQAVTSATSTTSPSTTTQPGGYTSRFVTDDHDIHDYGSNSSSNNSLAHVDRSRAFLDRVDNDTNDNDNDVAEDRDDEDEDISANESSSSDDQTSSNNINNNNNKRDVRSNIDDDELAHYSLSSSNKSDDKASVIVTNKDNNNANGSATRLLQSNQEISDIELAGARAPPIHDESPINATTMMRHISYDNDNNHLDNDNRSNSQAGVKIFVEGKQWTSLEDHNAETINDRDNNNNNNNSEDTTEDNSYSKTDSDDDEQEESESEHENERNETESQNVRDKSNDFLQNHNNNNNNNKNNINNDGENAIIKENGWTNGHADDVDEDEKSMTESEEESEVDEEKGKEETNKVKKEGESEISSSESDEKEEDENESNTKKDGVTEEYSINGTNVPIIKYKPLEDQQNLFDDNGWVVTDESLISASQNHNKYSMDENGWVIPEESNNETYNKKLIKAKNNTEINNNKSEDIKFKDGHWSIGENGWMVLSDEDDEQEATANKKGGAQPPLKRDSEDTSANDTSLPMQMVTTVFCVSVLCCSVLINLFM